MFAGNGFRCRLTGLAERYGAEHGARTPDPTARQAPDDGSLPLAELVGTGLEVPTVQGGTTRYVNLGYAAGVSVLRAAADHEVEVTVPAALTDVGSLEKGEGTRPENDLSQWTRGSWFEIWNGEAFVKSRLRWISPLRTMFMFSSGPVRASNPVA